MREFRTSGSVGAPLGNWRGYPTHANTAFFGPPSSLARAAIRASSHRPAIAYLAAVVGVDRFSASPSVRVERHDAKAYVDTN
jgi:hypothetical protein